MSWLKTLKSMLPGVATAVSGPIGGVVVKVIADKLGVEENAEAITKHLVDNPADLEKLKDLELEFSKLAVKDRESARAREIALAALGGISKAATPLLAFMTVGAAFAFCYALIFFSLPQQQEQIIIFVLGFVTASATQVLSYYFGSSVGSKDKTDELRRLVK